MIFSLYPEVVSIEIPPEQLFPEKFTPENDEKLGLESIKSFGRAIPNISIPVRLSGRSFLIETVIIPPELYCPPFAYEMVIGGVIACGQGLPPHPPPEPERFNIHRTDDPTPRCLVSITTFPDQLGCSQIPFASCPFGSAAQYFPCPERYCPSPSLSPARGSLRLFIKWVKSEPRIFFALVQSHESGIRYPDPQGELLHAGSRLVPVKVAQFPPKSVKLPVIKRECPAKVAPESTRANVPVKEGRTMGSFLCHW